MKSPFFIPKVALMLLLLSCSEQKSENDASILESPSKPEALAHSEDMVVERTAQLSSTKVNVVDQESAKIIGTWVSEEDSNSKWIFKSDGKCYHYYEGELIRTSNYSISNTSPQCYLEVDVDEYSFYLQLTDLADEDQMCYAIETLDDKYLSLRVVGQGGGNLYIRQ